MNTNLIVADRTAPTAQPRALKIHKRTDRDLDIGSDILYPVSVCGDDTRNIVFSLDRVVLGGFLAPRMESDSYFEAKAIYTLPLSEGDPHDWLELVDDDTLRTVRRIAIRNAQSIVDAEIERRKEARAAAMRAARGLAESDDDETDTEESEFVKALLGS